MPGDALARRVVRHLVHSGELLDLRRNAGNHILHGPAALVHLLGVAGQSAGQLRDSLLILVVGSLRLTFCLLCVLKRFACCGHFIAVFADGSKISVSIPLGKRSAFVFFAKCIVLFLCCGQLVLAILGFLDVGLQRLVESIFLAEQRFELLIILRTAFPRELGFGHAADGLCGKIQAVGVLVIGKAQLGQCLVEQVDDGKDLLLDCRRFSFDSHQLLEPCHQAFAAARFLVETLGRLVVGRHQLIVRVDDLAVRGLEFLRRLFLFLKRGGRLVKLCLQELRFGGGVAH